MYASVIVVYYDANVVDEIVKLTFGFLELYNKEEYRYKIISSDAAF